MRDRINGAILAHQINPSIYSLIRGFITGERVMQARASELFSNTIKRRKNELSENIRLNNEILAKFKGK